jgi:peroxiredoxin Q/BCP
MVLSSPVLAADLKVGDDAPRFNLKNQAGQEFDLNTRQGQWTVLYFYPKASTPGCTKQACAFRDNIKKIRAVGADVYGVSADTVEDQASFHKEHKLTFDLLCDPDANVIAAYGAKMPLLSISKRWTFILNPALKIAAIEKDVDPVIDSEKIADRISELKK